MNKFFSCFILSLFLIIFSGAAHAEGPNDAQALKAAQKELNEQMEIAAQERRAAAEKTYLQVSDLLLSLSEFEQHHFLIAYTNYNLIETVKVVQKDVSTAIDKCGENNPDMKGALQDRFGEWNKALKSPLKDAEAAFKNMLIAQDYASKKQLDEVFSSVDLARSKTFDQIEKIPVTTPEACQYLLSKMDETQDNMLNILKTAANGIPGALEKVKLDIEQKKKARQELQKRPQSEKVE